MARADEKPPKIDGRRLRRERNREAVIEAVLEMFNDEMLVPTIEKAAEHSGLSLRSVYRFFPDPESLIEAATETMLARGAVYAHLSDIGRGPFEDRLADFARMRVRLYEQVGNCFRATRHHAPNYVSIRENLQRTRRMLTQQFEQHFAPEIDALPASVRLARTVAADLMSQLDSIDLLRRHRRLTVAETIEVVAESVRTSLVSPASVSAGR